MTNGGGGKGAARVNAAGERARGSLYSTNFRAVHACEDYPRMISHKTTRTVFWIIAGERMTSPCGCEYNECRVRESHASVWPGISLIDVQRPDIKTMAGPSGRPAFCLYEQRNTSSLLSFAA